MTMLHVRHLGCVEYLPCWQAMREFTEQRGPDTADEFWLLQHPRVFTQGQAGKAEHVLAPGDIPVVQVDRGGQVTYHGPGQIVGYVLVDLRRRGLGVRNLVSAIEASIVRVLGEHGLAAAPRPDAPGVYLDTGAKIAQLGLRVRRGCTFHGLSLNVAMELEPFRRINPCGHAGLAVTDMRTATGRPQDFEVLERALADALCAELGYAHWELTASGLPGPGTVLAGG